MGLCEYCQNNPADHEVIDDGADFGVAMICEECFKELNLETEEENN